MTVTRQHQMHPSTQWGFQVWHNHWHREAVCVCLLVLVLYSSSVPKWMLCDERDRRHYKNLIRQCGHISLKGSSPLFSYILFDCLGLFRHLNIVSPLVAVGFPFLKGSVKSFGLWVLFCVDGHRSTAHVLLGALSEWTTKMNTDSCLLRKIRLQELAWAEKAKRIRLRQVNCGARGRQSVSRIQQRYKTCQKYRFGRWTSQTTCRPGWDREYCYNVTLGHRWLIHQTFVKLTDTSLRQDHFAARHSFHHMTSIWRFSLDLVVCQQQISAPKSSWTHSPWRRRILIRGNSVRKRKGFGGTTMLLPYATGFI